jgi:hypothetical protein
MGGPALPPQGDRQRSHLGEPLKWPPSTCT